MQELTFKQVEDVNGGMAVAIPPAVKWVASAIAGGALYDGAKALVNHVKEGGDGTRSCSGQMARSCNK